MDFKAIQDMLQKLKNDLQPLTKNEIDEVEPSLNVVQFNQVVDTLKFKSTQNEKESEFFKNVFNNDDYYENISSHLEQTQLALEHKIKKSGVSPEANIKIQQSLELVETISDILVVEYNNLDRSDRDRWLKKSAPQMKKIKGLLSELTEIKKQLADIVYADSKVVSNVVLKEFKMIFTFFTNCIKVAKNRNDELLLVEVSAIADRIMNMIKPVFKNKNLSIDTLIYYYLFYELRELKTSAIGNRLA